MPRPRSSSPLILKIKQFDSSLPLPAYKTSGSIAFDLACRRAVTVRPGQIAYIPLNIALKLPSGFLGLMVPRSSLHKMGLLQINSVGVFDQDYCGNNDEYLLAAYNFTSTSVTIDKGTRLAQLLIFKFHPVKFKLVKSLSSPNRGGFGSTGTK